MSARRASEIVVTMQEPPARSRRIIGFDSWAQGAHHFERLVAALRRRDATLKLIHLGSWGNEPGRPRTERIGELEVRDIGFYGGFSFEKVLDAETPDAVILLSIDTFAHRAMLRYCRRRAIPTLLLYHGLVNVQVTSDRSGSYGHRKLAHARFVGSKLRKVLSRTLPCYINALIRTRATIGDWRRFLVDALRMATRGAANRLITDPHSDATTTQCAVYTEADLDHAIRSYAYRPQDVHVVGNPDLARFGLTAAMLGSRLAPACPTQPAVVYIDTGLVNNGLVFRSYDHFIGHLTATARALAAQGVVMLLKPHPSHDAVYLRARLANSPVQVISNGDLVPRLLEARACLVEPTTLALLPGLLGMPMFYAGYGELGDLRYGPVLMSYPRGYPLADIHALTARLAEVHSTFDARRAREWIRHHAGPTPLDDMPERVAAAVEALCASRAEGLAAK